YRRPPGRGRGWPAAGLGMVRVQRAETPRKVAARAAHPRHRAAWEGAADALRPRLDALQPQPALRRVEGMRCGPAAGHDALAARCPRNIRQGDPALLRLRYRHVARL